MRLCFLAEANSIHSYLWINYFAKKGYEVYWISLTPNNFGSIKNVKFYLMKDFSIKPLNIILNINPFRELIKEINPDILHAHYAGVNGNSDVLCKTSLRRSSYSGSQIKSAN